MGAISMGKLRRRALTTSVATAAIFAFGVGQANAHFCFKTELNARAAQGMAGSANWVSFSDLAFQITGLCPEGIEILADAAGATTSTLINGHGLMAGGTLKKGPDAGNKAISHLDFEGIDAATPAAEEACA
jgi:hypothetical protein